MRLFRSSLVLSIVVLALATYVYFLEYRASSPEHGEHLFTGQVSDIMITSGKSGKQAAFHYKEGQWLLNRNEKVALSRVVKLLDSLGEIPERTISTGPSTVELSEYGLDSPVLLIDLDNGKELISIGSSVPVGFGRYVYIKNRNTIVVSSAIYDSFEAEVK